MRGVKRKGKYLQIHSISQIQQAFCFKIVLKDPSYSENYAFQGRIFRSTPLAKSFFGKESAKSVGVFLKLQEHIESLFVSKISFKSGAGWPFNILNMKTAFK